MTYETSLPPPLATFLEEVKDCHYYPYYTGPFEHYEAMLLDRHHVSSDLPPLLAMFESKVGPIIEIGAGVGRATIALSDRCSTLIALERSTNSVAKLHKATKNLPKLVIREIDFLDYYVPNNEKADCIVFSSLSINLVLEEQLDQFLEKCDQLLAPQGCFVFGCFLSESLTEFSKYTGKIGSSSLLDVYTDEEGEERVMHTNTMYVPSESLLLQNWFVDLHKSTKHPRYAVSALDEKLWTVETLKPYLES